MVLSGLPAGTLSFLICTREPGTKVMAKKHLPYHLCTPHGFILVNQTQQVRTGRTRFYAVTQFILTVKNISKNNF
jgi:hypothetical protein